MLKKIKFSSTLSIIMLCLCITATMLITACSQKNGSTNKPKNEKTVKIKSKARAQTLFFSGTISPIAVNSVTSPVAGSVHGMFFSYGERIKKGSLLLVIYSNELDKSYQQVVSAYLKAKEGYHTSQNALSGSKGLYKAGIISLESYQGKESALDDAYLNLLQAEHNLAILLKKVGVKREGIEALKIGDPTAVHKVLAQKIGKIKIKATADGVALKPTKAALTNASGGSGDSSDEPLEVGSQIKQGDLLVALGNMSGLSVNVNVDEININQIKMGSKAIITSAAFPGITLQGIVTNISSQSNDSDGGGGIPTFPIKVNVLKLTPKQQKIIHVGMSAKIEIVIQKPKGIWILGTAVSLENGQSYVRMKKNKGGKTQKVEVETGETTLTEVEITKGLKAGEYIVVSD